MEINGYTDLEITSSKKPPHIHLIYEHSDESLYIVDSTDLATILKSVDKGENWSTIITETGRIISAFYPNRVNSRLYYLNYSSTSITMTYIDLTNDSIHDDNTTGAIGIIGYDVLRYGSPSYASFTVQVLGNIRSEVFYSATLDFQDMGAEVGRDYDQSQFAVIGDKFYFLWKWSNENVELWRYDATLNTFTQMVDCGTTTELLDIKQRAIAYDGSDVLHFVLGTGIKEISTVVAVAPGSISDGTYFILFANDKDGNEIEYYCWFDKVGDSSGDPAPGGKIEIRCNISGSSTDQDVSDVIQAAIDAVITMTGANGSGTSTTTTITNHQNGNVTNIADVDSGLSVAVSTSGINNTNYLYTYTITTDTLTQHGIYNIALMLNRNPATGVQEKAFHISEDKVYQLHSAIPYQIYLISTFDFADTILAITDSFLICNGGEMYEFENYDDYVYNLEINYGYMKIPSATMTAIDLLKISEGMFIIIKDMFTTAGSSASQILFEGYVVPFVEQRFQEVILRSPATELLNIKPEGDYSGRTDEIITSLLLDYAGYVTKGTFSAGTELGQIHFNGDKSLFQILNEFALTDNFIWALTPIGQLYYNNGTVDSTIDIAETDNISRVLKRKGLRAINDVKIKGSIVAGDQAQGDGAQDLEDQQLNGSNPFERTISHLNTNALCTTTENNILTRWGTQATLIDFIHRDPTIGVIQSGQTITFQNNKTDPNIGSAQFSIKDIIYDAKNQFAGYIIGDRIL